MNKKIIIILNIAFIVFALSTYSNAYDNLITHKDITRKSVPYSDLDNYLNQNLGIKKGYKEVIKGKQIIEQLTDGSEYEDYNIPQGGSFLPQCRAVNHFHNPLLPWDQSYMTDQPWWVNEWCWDWKPIYSNITWATSYLSPPPDGARVPFTYSSSYSPYTWDRARDYYYKALTLTTEEDREIYFAWTFQTVGHVIHLLEDMAVPAHTRNDFQSHYIRNNNSFFDRIQPFEHYVKMNPQLVATASPSITDFPSFINPRLTDFWDTNSYNGSNPSTFNNIGLAEFTNANYFSDYTIPINNPTPEHTFPYPYTNDISYQICPQEVMPGILQKYISRKNGQPCPLPTNGEAIDHFAAVGLLSGYPDPNTISYIWLDDNVHNTYASQLIPRAVGYSAGLLNYFFRGELNMEEDTDTGSGYVIVNNTEEDMEGTFEIYYDDVNDNRKPVSQGIYNFSLNALSSGNNKSSNIDFTLPEDAKEPDKYMLVFKGRLGNEEDAVIGKLVEFKAVPSIFLVNARDKEIIMFDLIDNGNSYAIDAVEKDISSAVEFHWGWPTLLTIQSNPDKNKHMVALPVYLENNIVPHTYIPSIRRYGLFLKYGSPYRYVMRGLSGAYIPIDFQQGSEYAWHEAIAGEENDEKWPNPHWANGRKPFSIINNKLDAKNISIWRETSGDPDLPYNYYIRYKDESVLPWGWVRGMDLPSQGGVTEKDVIAVLDFRTTNFTSTPEPVEYFAVLNKEKTINATFSQYIKDYETVITRIDKPWGGDILYLNHNFKNTYMKNLYAGDTLIKTFTKEGERDSFYWYNGSIDHDIVMMRCGSDLFTNVLPNSSSTQGEEFQRVMDYDHNEDKDIIMFYEYTENSSNSSGQDAQYFGDPGLAPFGDAFWTINSNSNSKITWKYKLFYKIKDKIEIINIPYSNFQSSSNTTSIASMVFCPDPSYNINSSTTKQGDRISGISTQINDENMIYTYIVETLDLVTEQWNFSKRIIGVINISDPDLPVGYRQEFEINDSNASQILSDVYADYDYKDLAAIGIHKGE